MANNKADEKLRNENEGLKTTIATLKTQLDESGKANRELQAKAEQADKLQTEIDKLNTRIEADKATIKDLKDRRKPVLVHPKMPPNDITKGIMDQRLIGCFGINDDEFKELHELKTASGVYAVVHHVKGEVGVGTDISVLKAL
ncbi:MAG: hypothetical protein GY866_24100 [Proteobacteria bacterium]|nr:hypothetical protein [Pseudomonadota bacterium]